MDLERFPLDTLGSEAANTFVDGCRRQLSEHGLFNLEGFLRPATLERCVREVKPLLDSAAFVHKRRHNIYFDDGPTELADNHPALKQFETINHTICADQIPGSLICRIYEWPPLATFLAAVLDKTELHLMADPLARVNVIAYRAGEALNWHFDRSEFTTTLILQSPARGGEFQYRDALRSDDDANYDGVGRLLAGEDDAVKTLPLPPGTLSVFKGKNTAHRLTPIEGPHERIVAVFSYYENRDVVFTEKERVGFYGRAE